jgi:hypothetical protein
MKTICFYIVIFISFFTLKNAFSQGEIIDDFSKKALPDWIWGGVEMKYSHSEDNKENGYSDIISKLTVKKNAYIGKILLKRSHLFTAGNYVNVMLKGVNNDVNVKLQLIYDTDNNTFYDQNIDVMLESKPVSLNFDGWKEIKFKLDQENFKIVSKKQDSFEITEDAAFGIQMEFEAGDNYKESNFESGIALVSEIPNKEAFSEFDTGSTVSKESYFNAKNFPNPFNPSTTITYILPEPTYVSLNVYDRLGRQIISLVEQNQDSGEHSVEFNASEYPSGIYFYRIKTPERTEVRKMLFTK